MPPVAGFPCWLRSLLQGGRTSDVARWHRALMRPRRNLDRQCSGPIAVWHPDSTTLIMFSYASVEKRARCVRANRPPHEIPTRLRLMKSVRGPLPTAVEEAFDEVERAERALEEATHEYITKRTASARVMPRNDWQSRRAQREQQVMRQSKRTCPPSRRSTRSGVRTVYGTDERSSQHDHGGSRSVGPR